MTPGIAAAATVPVANGDFEDWASIGDGSTGAGWASFPGAAGGLIADAIPLNDEFWANPGSFGSGWQSNGAQPTNGKYGLQHPSDSQHTRDGSHQLVAPANGEFIGFVNLNENDGEGASAGQVQSAVVDQLREGVYTLNVAVGARLGANWEAIEYTISLVAGGLTAGDPLANQFGTSGGAVLGSASTVLDPPGVAGDNEWADLQLVLNVDNANAFLGQDVAIRIDVVNQGAAGTFTQANFDNVRLDYVPEPGSLALAAIGGLALLRRRR